MNHIYDMAINPRVTSLNKSATLKITALTKKLIKEGKDVVNFAAGEPDFDTPDFIKQGAKKAIDSGYTKYTPSVGLPQLRQKIASKLKRDNNLDVDEKNIIVTAGAKYALFVAIFGLSCEDDEVIIASPYWVSYPEMVKLAGAKAKFLTTDIADNFKINPKKLEEAITSKTKVLILNYPSNPTGTTYTKEELEAIYDVLKDKNIFVISDEIYETLVYDGRKHVSFASIGQARDFTITVNGFSKAFSMTGWRIGYLVGPAQTVAELSKIIDHTTSCTSSISQWAAFAALDDQEWQRSIREEFKKRRDILWEGLNSYDKLAPLKSEGTFYMFCDIRKTGLSSLDFSTKLLEDHLVSCIPAFAFGLEGFVRLSFSTSIEQINKGIERIGNFVNNL